MPYDRHTLLCEFHAHTTWSDGVLSLPELVDLYGNAGFDVLCVTDHVVAGRAAHDHVHPGNYGELPVGDRGRGRRARSTPTTCS